MKPLALVFALSVLAGTTSAGAATHPFNAKDLVMMSRVSDPQLSPDGQLAAFSVRATDFKANKGVSSVWVKNINSTRAR
jgi:dipeptidyl aminopeptidase/acylaminoacyl peptidase